MTNQSQSVCKLYLVFGRLFSVLTVVVFFIELILLVLGISAPLIPLLVIPLLVIVSHYLLGKARELNGN